MGVKERECLVGVRVSKICGREREERERKKGKEKENEVLRRQGALRKKKKERGRRGEERGVE
jgi:hypothetical protein